MRYRALTANGDMTFGSSALNFLVDSPASVAQAVQTTILLWLGEWYLNVNDGTPFLEEILGYNSKDSADQAFRERILSVQATISSSNIPSGTQPGQVVQAVTSIENFVSVINETTRSYSLTCLLNTIYGPTPLEIENIKNF